MRQRADLWSWIALDGAVVGKYQNLRMELPSDDLSDLTLGPLHVLTKTALRSYAVSAAYDDGTRSDVVYEAFTDPFATFAGQWQSRCGSASFIARTSAAPPTPCWKRPT